MSQKQLQLGELHQQMMVAQMFPKFELDREADSREARLAELKLEKTQVRASSRGQMRSNDPQLQQRSCGHRDGPRYSTTSSTKSKN